MTQWGAVRQTHRQGFTSDHRVQAAHPTVTQQDYYFLTPLNEQRVWLKNRVVAHKAIPGLEHHMARQFCTIRNLDNVLDIVRLRDFPDTLSPTISGILELIQQQSAARVVPVKWNRGLGRMISWDGDEFRIDGWPASEQEVAQTISQMAEHGRCVVQEHDDHAKFTGEQFGLRDAYLRFYVGKNSDGEAQVLDAEYVGEDQWRQMLSASEDIEAHKDALGIRRGWSKRRQMPYLGEERFARVDTIVDADAADTHGVSGAPVTGLNEVASRLEELFSDELATFTFLAIDVVLTPSADFRVHDILSYVRFPSRRTFSDEAQAFLAQQLELKRQRVAAEQRSMRERISHKVRRYRAKYDAFHLRSQGYTARMARAWVALEGQRKKQKVTDETTVAEHPQHWGFTPATVRRLGVQRSNLDQFISERDYFFAQPLNGKYAKWVRDRVSARTIFEPYSDLFEPMHYQLLRRGNDLQIIPLSDQARAYDATIEGMGALMKELNGLTLASSTWTGRVALPITCDGATFVVDGRVYTPDEFQKLLTFRVRKQFYVLLEPAGTDVFVGDYSTDGDTELRILMVNPDGATPRAVDAALVIRERPDSLTDEVLDRLKVTARQAARLSATRSDESLESDIERAEHQTEASEEGVHLGYDQDEIDMEVEEHLTDDAVQSIELVSPVDPATGAYSGTHLPVGNRLLKIKQHPVTQRDIAGTIDVWDEVQQMLAELCRFAPQLEFVRFTLRLTEQGPRVVSMSALPPYNRNFAYSDETVRFLQEKVRAKRQKSSGLRVSTTRWLHNAKLKIRRTFAARLYPKGLVPYQSVRWLGDIRRDFTQRNGVNLRTKLWAYRHGFLSYRIPQYGITPENRTDFISDFEYRWLRHINKKYKYWLEDKISIKYVAARHNECLPGYYFYTTTQGDESNVVPMMDCPAGYEATYDDILRLARVKGVLALKPDEGSHGEGFYRLAYEAGEYSLNGEPASEEQVLTILKNPENEYLITEFIEMHPDLARIYPHSVNTIRIIVFKKDGITPTIGNAYLRIGSLKSGFVDNTAAGGMLAEINADTGAFGNAQILENGRVSPCSHHPDTGVLIEGTVPNWEYVKEKVLEMATDLPQLEYLGFDLAITADGFKIPEINRFPDYPRIDKLTPQTIDYLLYKVAEKKRLYGYDKRAPRTLIKLPSRG